MNVKIGMRLLRNMREYEPYGVLAITYNGKQAFFRGASDKFYWWSEIGGLNKMDAIGIQYLTTSEEDELLNSMEAGGVILEFIPKPQYSNLFKRHNIGES